MPNSKEGQVSTTDEHAAVLGGAYARERAQCRICFFWRVVRQQQVTTAPTWRPWGPRTGAGEEVQPAAGVGKAAAAAQLPLEDVENGAPHHLHHRPRRVALR